MRVLLLITLLILSQYGDIYSQSDKNMWLKDVDPKLLGKVNLDKIPNAPNKIDFKGNRTGLWIYWLSKTHYETTKPENVYLYRKAKYINGEIVGRVEDYYLDGTLSATGNIVNNEFDGEVIYYRQNGSKEKAVTFVIGKLNGKWNKYNEQDRLIIEGNYSDDLRTGLWSGYYDNGKVKFIGQYVNNEKKYVWTYLNEKSEITKMEFYEHDIMINNNDIVDKIQNLLDRGDIEECKIMNNEYSKYTSWMLGDKNLEYAKTLYFKGNILKLEDKISEAILVLDSLIILYDRNKSVSEPIYHKSLLTLSNLYKKIGNISRSFELLNQSLQLLDSEPALLPFEKNIILDELSEIFIAQNNFDMLEKLIQKTDLNEWIEKLGHKDQALFAIRKYFNDNSINDFRVLSKNKVYIFDTRITELAYKDVILAEVRELPKNEIINRIVTMYNLINFSENIERFLKQFNSSNRFNFIDKSIMDSLISKYNITFKEK